MSEIADGLKGLMEQLKAENAKLKGDLANIHAALRPFIAGGSVEEYRTLWESINGKTKGARWADNPLVWVLVFEVVQV